MDTVTREKRSKIMSCIRGKDTIPEITVRKFLFKKGFRFRKNDKRYPGSPDIVLPKYKTVIFVNGCFWHGHEGCKYYSIPKTNVEFWESKIEINRNRDKSNYEKLYEMGFKVIILWECELKRDFEGTMDKLLDDLKQELCI